MEITNAKFVISNTDVKKCPAGTFPEYAFIGRISRILRLVPPAAGQRPAGDRFFWPLQCGKIQPHQYADRTKGAGHDFRYSR